MCLVYGPGIPAINPFTGGFVGGIKTNYGSFMIRKHPRIPAHMDSMYESEETDDYQRPSYVQNNYYNKYTRHRSNIIL